MRPPATTYQMNNFSTDVLSYHNCKPCIARDSHTGAESSQTHSPTHNILRLRRFHSVQCTALCCNTSTWSNTAVSRHVKFLYSAQPRCALSPDISSAVLVCSGLHLSNQSLINVIKIIWTIFPLHDKLPSNNAGNVKCLCVLWPGCLKNFIWALTSTFLELTMREPHLLQSTMDQPRDKLFICPKENYSM